MLASHRDWWLCGAAPMDAPRACMRVRSLRAMCSRPSRPWGHISPCVRAPCTIIQVSNIVVPETRTTACRYIDTVPTQQVCAPAWWCAGHDCLAHNGLNTVGFIHSCAAAGKSAALHDVQAPGAAAAPHRLPASQPAGTHGGGHAGPGLRVLSTHTHLSRKPGLPSHPPSPPQHGKPNFISRRRGSPFSHLLAWPTPHRHPPPAPPQCGKPNFFISHRWGSPFSHLLTALKKDIGDKEGNHADKPDVFVWLDVFAVNQHPGGSEGECTHTCA